MKEWVIKKRLGEMSENGKLTAESNKILLNEYHKDKMSGVPIEESEARTILIMGNLQLVAYILVKKFNITNLDRSSDEYSVAKIGLIKAIDNFDVNKDVAFSTYATRVILNEIYMHHRRENNLSHGSQVVKISIDECMMERFRGEPQSQYSHSFSEENDFVEMAAQKDLFERAQRCFKYLSPNEMEYITLYFGLDGNSPITQEQVAERVGRHRSMVSRVIRRGLEKLNVLLKNPADLTTEEMQLRNRIINEAETKNIEMQIK